MLSTSIGYVRKQLEFALGSPSTFQREDAIRRALDGLDHLQSQAEQADALLDAQAQMEQEEADFDLVERATPEELDALFTR